MAPKTEVLKFRSGKHLRVRVSLTGQMLIKAYLLDLKEAIGNTPVYPPTLEVENGLTLQDSLYQKFKQYYQAIADNLIPPVNTEQLDPLCRHEFFICGDPISYWESPDTQIPGLSKLEKLLGYSYPEPGQKSQSGTSGFEPPSNDYSAYMIAALVINFPNSGLELADRYDSDFLNKILKDAAHLSDPDKIDKPTQVGVISFNQSHEVDEHFEKERDFVVSKLHKMGVTVPEDF